MVLAWNIPTKPKKYILIFIITFSTCSFQKLVAQDEADSSKIPLLASLEKNEQPGFASGRANVLFPEILKGNEVQTLSYIEKFSADKREYLTRMYSTGKAILPRAAAILKKYNLPEELSVLLALESEYKGNVVSRSGAVGCWQIMDVMAKNYGIKYVSRYSVQNNRSWKSGSKMSRKRGKVFYGVKDDRKNFNVATHTAARYLLDSKKQLNNNWLLVVASYNCGVGRVKKAIKRSGIANPCFWDIKDFLPSQTRAYVMNFITLNVIFNNYDRFSRDKLVFIPDKIIFTNQLEQNMPANSYENTDR